MNIIGTFKTQHGELTIAQNGDNVTATYQDDGVCSGKLIGNKVEGIWKNKKDHGLFEWTFLSNDRFIGKYKSGLEKGTMRGKWDGNQQSLTPFNSGKMIIFFEVVQENGGKVELTFSNAFENLSFGVADDRIIVDDYHNIIMDKKVLEFCCDYIDKADSFLMENDTAYALRVVKINTCDLTFLWHNEMPVQNDVECLKDFYTNYRDPINIENYEDVISEFRQDYICPMSYVKAFS